MNFPVGSVGLEYLMALIQLLHTVGGVSHRAITIVCHFEGPNNVALAPAESCRLMAQSGHNTLPGSPRLLCHGSPCPTSGDKVLSISFAPRRGLADDHCWNVLGFFMASHRICTFE
ncbi:hypothetical protein V8B97DRAFT_1991752 [Scleroderma yunnanense]